MMGGANQPEEGQPMNGKRTFERARDSRGLSVQGLSRRDGAFYMGARIDGRWTMKKLEAETLTEARRERDSILSGLREGRIAQRDGATFGDCFTEFQDSRRLSERTRKHE